MLSRKSQYKFNCWKFKSGFSKKLSKKGIHLLSVTPTTWNRIKWNLNRIFITYSYYALLILDYDPNQFGVSHSKHGLCHHMWTWGYTCSICYFSHTVEWIMIKLSRNLTFVLNICIFYFKFWSEDFRSNISKHGIYHSLLWGTHFFSHNSFFSSELNIMKLWQNLY